MRDGDPALRCERCGYVALLDLPPGECPDCGGTAWRFGELVEE